MFRTHDLHDRGQPFAPFRVHTTDGHHHDVTHPDAFVVGNRHVQIGSKLTDARSPTGCVERVAIAHVVRIAPLGTSALELVAPERPADDD